MSGSITIRNVPNEVRDERAARAGKSLQEYLRNELISAASRPEPEALIARARERVDRTGTRLGPEALLRHRAADRL